MPKQTYEIVPASETGADPDRVKYALVGHGPGSDAHHQLRFGTHEEAMGHMEKYGLEYHTGPARTNLGDAASAPDNSPEAIAKRRAMFQGFGWGR
jgi:hypothetical protein